MAQMPLRSLCLMPRHRQHSVFRSTERAGAKPAVLDPRLQGDPFRSNMSCRAAEPLSMPFDGKRPSSGCSGEGRVRRGASKVCSTSDPELRTPGTGAVWQNGVSARRLNRPSSSVGAVCSKGAAKTCKRRQTREHTPRSRWAIHMFSARGCATTPRRLPEPDRMKSLVVAPIR